MNLYRPRECWTTLSGQARQGKIARAVAAFFVLALLGGLAIAAVPGLVTPAFARPLLTSYSVNTTSDELDAGACGSITSGAGPDGLLSLREAICEANNNGAGPHTISVPAGMYTLSQSLGALQVAPNGNQSITISGAGAGNTVIQATNANCPSGVECNNRVFVLDAALSGNAVVTIQNLTIAHGRSTDPIGGAGLLAGCEAPDCPNGPDTTTLSGVTFDDNAALYFSPGAAGGAIQNIGGTLIVQNSTFLNNTGGNYPGGAIFYDSHAPSSGTLTVSNSTFLGNSSNADNHGGGAIYVTAAAGSTLNITGSLFTNNSAGGSSAGGAAIYKDGPATLNIDHSTFTGNQVSSSSVVVNLSSGGAIDVNAGTLNLSFSRLTGNTAALSGKGNGVYTASGATLSAVNNWWGCNDGPAGAGCDSVSGAGSNTTSPWIVLSLSASPNPVWQWTPTTLTASFLQNSAATALTPSQVSVLNGLPIIWNGALNGTFSNQQTVLQSGGTATATFNAGSAGPGSANANVDNATASASITIQIFPFHVYLPGVLR